MAAAAKVKPPAQNFDHALYATTDGDKAKRTLLQLGWFQTDTQFFSLNLSAPLMHRWLEAIGTSTPEETLEKLLDKYEGGGK